jgi:hypothetical protein
MNTAPNQSPAPKSKGCLIKIILGCGIIFIGAFINVAMTGSGQRTNPIITIVMGCAILALWAWKPSQPANTTEIDVKPLDKKKNED